MNRPEWHRAAKTLQILLRGEVRVRVPLAPYTTFRIGGPADLLVCPADVEDLERVWHWSRAQGCPVRILGGGSNLLVGDEGVRGLCLLLQGPTWTGLEIRPLAPGWEEVRAGAGVPLARLLQVGLSRGWEGIGFAAGIPGTLGGALRLNAGTYLGEMGPWVHTITVWEEGEVREIPGAAAGFVYRGSRLGGRIILEARLRFPLGDPESLRAQVREALRRRQATQPVGWPSAGSVFKNPPGIRAWELIHQVGMRGVRRGGARVSPLHANYIINEGRAQAVDVLALMEEIQRRVRQTFGIDLEPEIHLLREEGP